MTLRRAGSAHSPCHTPLVNGWQGSTERAHANTCGSSSATRSSLSVRSTEA